MWFKLGDGTKSAFVYTTSCHISKIGIVPVVKIDNAKDAAPLAKALINGGLPCAEVTFRTAAAEEAIANTMKVLCGIYAK